MHVDRIPNRTSPPAFLLRETYREDGRVKKRTLANITHWPAGKIEALRRLLRDEYAPDLKLMRSLPHGHVAAALGILRKLGLDDLLAQGQRQRARMVALVTALVVVRLLDPASKLTTARLLDGTTATSSLGTVLALGKVDEQELYDALDWLLAQQERIETALARRHLSDGTLVLYDVSSTYFEGRTCELAKFGHNRDGKSGKLQIVFGLLCTKDGCPVAIEVFDGNVADPATLANQVKKLKERFALERVVLVGDRGMITEARIEEVLKPAGLDWITTLRAPAIRSLAEAGSLQLSLFDERDAPPSRRRIIRASASSPAAIRCWRTSAPASAKTCWSLPKRNSPPLRPAFIAPKSRCAARTRLRSRSAASSTNTKWPNILI